MAAEVGVSESTVGRIWARNGIKPHRVRTFKELRKNKVNIYFEGLIV